MDHTAIGFELTNAGAAVAPTLTDSQFYSNLQSPDNNTGGHMKPIGFEMHNPSFENGPTDVVSEKPHIALNVNGCGSEAALIDPDDPSKGVKVRRVNSVDPAEEETLFFSDNVRHIDYILAYEPAEIVDKENLKAKREYFEKELVRLGLQLEFESAEKSKSGKVAFVKVHAPWDILAMQAELMNMRMPLAPNDMENLTTSLFSCMPTPFDLDPDLVKEDDNYFTAPFNRIRMEQYIIKDKNTFFTNAQRSRMVYSILSRAHYEDADPQNPAKRRFGIKKLLANGSYSAAYPLHDGKFTSDHSILTQVRNERHLLYHVWARPGSWYKYQPLDKIRNYFGEKIGIYFAWLGFYTTMLIPAAIIGLVAFIYGCATIYQDTSSIEICDINKAGNMTMCPLCDGRCPYWRLEDSCNYSKATYLFDNPATVAFACFMALWASFFHELWKRKQAEIEYDWDVADFEDEEETVRPEFDNTVKKKRENPVNKRLEPYVPPWTKCIRYFNTVSVLLFFLALVVAAVFGVILYRIIIAAVFAASEDKIVRGKAALIASTTSAVINLVIILILNFLYQKIAKSLTEMEQHRTESEWEDAFTFKMFLFQFVNYYSSIIYIAFLKGRFIGRPGAYNRNLFDYRQEECNPAGCLIELCLQLAIIMVGKQAIANFKEVILPKLLVWYKSRSVQQDKQEKVYKHWEQDYNLVDQPKLGLFDEYLELVIQFGFVTIFVAAFPLAPLFAFLNNIIEIRLDAYKFVTQWKRPLAERAQDIGIWFGILQGISAIAVVTNAVIIAFTSEFIPKIVYKYIYSNDGTMTDYFKNFSMSTFNTIDYRNENNRSLPNDLHIDTFGIVTSCRYRDFREPNTYEFTSAFWHILAARLAFVVVFENMIVFLTWLIMYLVPDIPFHVKMQMLREKYLAKQSLFTAEEIKVSRPKAE